MERMSRRSVLFSVLGGVAGLALVPGRVLAAAGQQAGTTTRPTVAWAGTGAQSSGVGTFWATGPDRLQPNNALRPQRFQDRMILVSPDRLVQLRDGTVLSLVAWQQAGGWQYGVADLRRVTREGWNEQALTTGSGVPASQLLSKAVAALQGQPVSFSVLAQPAVPVT